MPWWSAGGEGFAKKEIDVGLGCGLGLGLALLVAVGLLVMTLRTAGGDLFACHVCPDGAGMNAVANVGRFSDFVDSGMSRALENLCAND